MLWDTTAQNKSGRAHSHAGSSWGRWRSAAPVWRWSAAGTMTTTPALLFRSRASSKKGGNLTLTVVTGPAIIDPQKSISIANGPADVWGLVATPLVRFDWKKGQIYDGQAEKWEFPDPLTLLIYLKKNTHFQQESLAKGREVDSSDVVVTLERLRAKGDATFTIASRFNLVDTYEAVDKYTVRVKFTKPDVNFLSWMYHPGAGIIHPKERSRSTAPSLRTSLRCGLATAPSSPTSAPIRRTSSST